MRKQPNGFTLLELLITVSILSLLVAIAVPSYQSWIQKARLKATARDLHGELQRARIQAIRGNDRTVIRFNAIVTGDPYDYIIFRDTNGNFRYQPGNETLLAAVRFESAQYDTSKGGGQGMTFANNGGSTPAFAWTGRGLPVNQDGSPASGEIFMQNLQGDTVRLRVSPAGTIRIEPVP